MSWQGANVSRSKRAARERNQQRSSETVEAALNRLSKSYTAALECVGACHRAAGEIGRTEEQRHKRAVLFGVARTARNTLQQAILADPLVRPHALGLTHLWETWSHGEERHWIPTMRQVEPPLLTSAAHRSTVRKLAYLSLLNYADLLLSGCTCGTYHRDTLLDRKAVGNLFDIDVGDNYCCWCIQEESSGDQAQIEPEADTTRLALVAYIDAANLDGSDPTVWFKMATTARRLDELLCSESGGIRRYQRLEKHALESAQACWLARRQPPNHLIARAWKEWQQLNGAEVPISQSIDVTPSGCKEEVLRLSLNRYSWAVVGRTLMRACREGTHFRHNPHDRCTSQSVGRIEVNPTVQLHMSPLLSLPSAVLARLITWLGEKDVAGLEFSCRALSVAVLAAKARADRALLAKKRNGDELHPTPQDPAVSGQSLHGTKTLSSSKGKEKAVQASRISKRVRSQILNSGRRAERSSRRSSVQYCLTGASLGAPPEILDIPEPSDFNIVTNLLSIRQGKEQDGVPMRHATGVEEEEESREALERVGPASLLNFVKSVSNNAATPLEATFVFLSHVSIHVDLVYSSETHGSLVLSACLMDAFDLLTRRTRFHSLNPCWLALNKDEGHHFRYRNFAVDLLYAELRLKRCERDENADTSFEGDINYVAMVLPLLLSFVEENEKPSNISCDCWIGLKVRVYWITSNFLLLRARSVLGAPTVREAEKECLSFLDKTISTLQESSINEVRTPHLEGTGRQGSYWKILSSATLKAFRSEIQASSVVLVAQDQFVDAMSRLDDDDELQSNSECQKVLTSIGGALLQRYDCPAGSPNPNTVELINDFISVHGNLLSSFPLKKDTAYMSTWFENLVPASALPIEMLRDLKSPCILTILAICLSFRPGGREKLINLLLNLILTIRDLRNDLQSTSTLVQQLYLDDSSGMSDDSSVMSEEDAMDEGLGKSNQDNSASLKIYSRLIALLQTVMARILDKNWLNNCHSDLAKTDLIERLLESAFAFTVDSATSRIFLEDDQITEDVLVYSASISFMKKLDAQLNNDDGDLKDLLDRTRMTKLVGLVVVHQRNLDAVLKASDDNPSPRKKWLLTGSLQLLRHACTDLGMFLSKRLCKRSGKGIIRSPLWSGVSESIPLLCKSLLWLWENCRAPADGSGKPTIPLRQGRGLRIPVAVAIVSLCGSASFSRAMSNPPNESQEHDIPLMDLVDSDASAAECVTEDDHSYEEILRVIFQAVQCIHLITESFQDDEFSEEISFYDGKNVQPLPLILERVANFFADTLLLNPSGQESDIDDNPLWSDYTYGTRSTGARLDALLHRAYKGLYGFSMLQVGDGKEANAPVTGEDAKPKAKPESVGAAAQLYRYVMRACSHGRKSPPKAALLTILAALPEVADTDQSEGIKKFLFSSDPASVFSTQDIKLLTKSSADCDSKFSSLVGFLEAARGETARTLPKDESEIVRKGLADLFSQGSMPALEDSAERDSRLQCDQVEGDLYNRFEAILYSLTHRSSADCEGWYRIAQLCLFKADMIADRLGMSAGFSRSKDFIPPSGNSRRKEQSAAFSGLIENQSREAQLRALGRTKSLGPNLLVYMKYRWSSVSSLKSLQRVVGEYCRSAYDEDDDTSQVQVWNEIVGLYTQERFSQWQQAWGGLFVSSLRMMAAKCMCLTLYIVQSNFTQSTGPRRSELIYETCEALGTALYTELVGSQWYGYPMQVMPHKEKRDVAETALACYSRAVSEEAVFKSSDGEENEERSEDEEETKTTWDLLFMIGKCNEKIAGTYKQEDFSGSDSRAYERNMRSALNSYSESLTQAQACEKEGTLVVEQQGGSSHGAMEALYRLHATRLKCLIRAVQFYDSGRELAEAEALRLTEPFPFSQRGGEGSSVRDRVWNVVVDVVSAMIHCRARHSFFHRSVYRHAQALMWAPILCDPVANWKEGCFGQVPALMALKMRGLNSESAVESASGVIRALFDKKRAQLCAVWVTSAGAESAFQRINVEVRKYDYLRGKYISAYLSCLELCSKKDDLENFLRWTSSCRRDLPSFFAASAGSKAPPSHNTDTLILKPRSLISLHFLTCVKREANAALSAVMLREALSSKAAKESKFLESNLKLSYSCLLRLNCDLSSLKKRRIRQSPGVKPVVDALIALHLKTSSEEEGTKTDACDWSIDGQISVQLEAAVKRCRELFPTLSGSFFTKKYQKKKKSGDDGESNKLVGSKRQEPDGSYTILKQFNVEVPEGLTAGESFLTEIKSGDKIKRIRLSVPEGGAASLRFNMRVQADSSDAAAD